MLEGDFGERENRPRSIAKSLWQIGTLACMFNGGCSQDSVRPRILGIHGRSGLLLRCSMTSPARPPGHSLEGMRLHWTHCYESLDQPDLSPEGVEGWLALAAEG